jgi:hypothetical protein
MNARKRRTSGVTATPASPASSSTDEESLRDRVARLVAELNHALVERNRAIREMIDAIRDREHAQMQRDRFRAELGRATRALDAVLEVAHRPPRECVVVPPPEGTAN